MSEGAAPAVTRCALRDCGYVAVAFPEVRFWATSTPAEDRRQDNALPVRLPLAHCERHCGIITAETLITDDGWKQIVSAVVTSGRVAPLRSSAQLVWLPLSAGV